MLVGISRHFDQREKSSDSSHAFGVTVLQGGTGRSVPANSGIVDTIADIQDRGKIKTKEPEQDVSGPR